MFFIIVLVDIAFSLNSSTTALLLDYLFKDYSQLKKSVVQSSSTQEMLVIEYVHLL